MQRHTYLTRRTYGEHAAGTKCFAFRFNRGKRLVLEFSNGDVIDLPGKYYVESSQDRPVEVAMEDDLIPLYTHNGPPPFIFCGEVVGPLNEMIMEFRHEIPEWTV